MVPLLNATGINAACLGNHDLDFGMEQFGHLSKRCTFPWLVANVLDPALGENVPMGNCKRTVMLTASNGIKVGIIGLVEREWLATLNSLPPNLKYLSASATATELAPKLREQGAEIVIALSHQRQPNDDKLATNIPPGTLDLILGGHDHTYTHSIINGTHLLRSGTDFKNLSYIEARRSPSPGKWTFDILRRDVVGSTPEDSATLQTVEKLTSALKAKMSKPIGFTASPLDARFTTVRRRESNLGNLVCDIMRLHYAADCALMAAGTIRGDQVYPPGVLRMKDVMNCFPFEDPCVVVRVRGSALVAALENGVSTYPALEGRFPQVSGLSFAFDPALPAGSRCSAVCVAGEPLQPEREYTCCTREYMIRGKDGFTSLLSRENGGEAECVVDEENGVLISTLLRQYFMSLRVLGRWRMWGGELEGLWQRVGRGVQEVHPVTEPSSPVEGKAPPAKRARRDGGGNEGNALPSLVGKAQVSSQPLADGADAESSCSSDVEEDDAGESSASREHALARKVVRKWWRLAGLKGQPACCAERADEGACPAWARGVAPRVEGRIVCLGEEVE